MCINGFEIPLSSFSYVSYGIVNIVFHSTAGFPVKKKSIYEKQKQLYCKMLLAQQPRGFGGEAAMIIVECCFKMSIFIFCFTFLFLSLFDTEIKSSKKKTIHQQNSIYKFFSIRKSNPNCIGNQQERTNVIAMRPRVKETSVI